jgi:molybdopterin synthase sulfur carrier subunit
MPKVQIPTPLRVHACGADVVTAEGATVGEVLRNLAAAYPALGERLFEGAEIRRFINIYVNNEDIRYLDDLNTPVSPDDEIAIIPAIAGG